MGLGILFMILGTIGVFRYKDFYVRLLIGCKVDTIGAVTLVIGVAIRHGFTFFTAKLGLVMVIMLLLIPLVTHILARSAYKNGFRILEKEEALTNKPDEFKVEEGESWKSVEDSVEYRSPFDARDL